MNTIIFEFFYQFGHRTVLADGLIVFLAEYLGYALIIVFLAMTLRDRDFKLNLKQVVWPPLLSGASAWIIATILKLAISAPRPFLILSDVAPLFPKDGSAFPSGHASFFGGFAISLVLSKAKGARWYALGALLIGLARIAAGVHWPADILTGFLVGVVVAYVVQLIFEKRLKRGHNANE